MDPYSLLGIDLDASDKQITSAYRKLSIKLHPDKNPDDPNAADKFHELNQAYQKLVDPIQRASIDQEIRKKRERELRYAQFDNKRKRMQEELEQREEAFKKSKSNAAEKRKQEQEADRIKEEGRRMREEAIAKAEEEEAARQKTNAPPPAPEPSDNKLDTTVRLKYSLSSHPALDSATALSTHLKENRFTNFDERSIVLSLKPAKGKKNKSAAVPIMAATALVPFNTVMDAFSLVCASGSEKRGLKDVQVTWASGTEPTVVANLKNHSNPPKEQPKSFSFSNTTQAPQSTVPGLDFESATLMRLRQAERDRLEREIREQEALEGS